jgi:stage III sporulation protein AB
MLIKLIGSLIIIISSALIGFLMGGYYRDRPRQLRELQSGLNMLETEIAYSQTPLPQALSRVSRRISRPIGTVFAHTAEILMRKSGLTASEAWSISLNRLYNKSSLRRGDCEILENLGGYLGASDKEDQIKHLKLAISQLKDMEYLAEDERRKNERIWNYLGVLSGLMLVLLII